MNRTWHAWFAVVITGAGCSSGEPTGPPPAPVTLEPATAVTQTIGPAGGSLTTTSSAGIQYTLEVPAGALMTSQEITLTPITDIRDLGLSGGLAGAVRLEPSGLVFAQPAVLRIKTSAAAPAGTRLVGFTADADFAERALSLAAIADDEVQVLVLHFSVVGGGFGTTTDLRIFSSQAQTLIDQALVEIAGFTSPPPWTDAERARADQLATLVFEDLVLPGLENATADVTLLQALSDYWAWRLILVVIDLETIPLVSVATNEFELAVPPEYEVLVTDANEAAANGIQLALGGNNGICATQASLDALRNVFFWHRQAVKLGVDDPAHQLDIGTILNDLCAKVILVSSNLPGSVTLGSQFSLDLEFQLEYDNGVKQVTDFQVDLTGLGATIANPSGFTGIGDPQSPIGFYTTVVTADAEGSIAVDARVCWAMERTPPDITELCGTFNLGVCSVSESASAGAHLGYLGAAAARRAGAAADGECEEPPPPPGSLSGTWRFLIVAALTDLSGVFVWDDSVTFNGGNASFSASVANGPALSGSITGTLSGDRISGFSLSNVRISELTLVPAADEPPCLEADLVRPGPIEDDGVIVVSFTEILNVPLTNCAIGGASALWSSFALSTRLP